jgi:methylated-DNA-protein-cysteine methyltransferase-like protein
MAPRSDEAEDFFAAVYQTVQEIPYGKVTSYGHIAKLIGRRVSFFSHFLSLSKKK